MVKIFSLPICMIFAREFLEAGIIVTNFRSIVRRMNWDEERTNATYDIINKAAGGATLLAAVMIIALAVALDQAGQNMSKEASQFTEGISKLVASVCIAQFSIKIPKWLGVYASKKSEGVQKDIAMLSPRSLLFNVSWNLWREMAEIGVFLIPYFLKGDLIQVPLGAIVGAIVGLGMGYAIHVANKKTQSREWLAFGMALLMGALAVGLFASGCAYCEKAMHRSTPTAIKFPKNKFWSTTGVGGGIFYVFGYSHEMSVLRIVMWWVAALGLCGLHLYKYMQTQKILAARAIEGSSDEKPVVEAELEKPTIDAGATV